MSVHPNAFDMYVMALLVDADKNRTQGEHVERGELWWAQIDEKQPVVLLSGGAGPEFVAIQIVEPATPSQKLGFVLMSGEQAVDVDERRRIVEEAGPDPRAIGI